MFQGQMASSRLRLTSVDDRSQHVLSVLVCENLCQTPRRVASVPSAFSHFSFYDQEIGCVDSEIHVLVGADYYWDFFQKNMPSLQHESLVASESSPGWILSG